MGYDVFLSPDAVPTSADEDRVVMFALDAATDAVSTVVPGPETDLPKRVIVVATGTPGKGAEVSAARPSARVFATTLAGLEEAYRPLAPGVVGGVEPFRVDGVASRLLHVEGFLLQSTWVLLAVTGGRSYVISARAFPTIDPGTSATATRTALIHFLDGVRFAGPPLYASRILGFEVTAPVDDDFTGFVRDTGPVSEANGTITFHAGVGEDGIHWSHSITVAGVRPSSQRRSSSVRRGQLVPLWAPSLAALVRAYSQAVGSSDYTEQRTLGGEPALYFVRPGGVGAAVVAVHRGRAYIISSSGTTDDAPAGQFRAFLDFVQVPRSAGESVGPRNSTGSEVSPRNVVFHRQSGRFVERQARPGPRPAQ